MVRLTKSDPSEELENTMNLLQYISDRWDQKLRSDIPLVRDHGRKAAFIAMVIVFVLQSNYVYQLTKSGLHLLVRYLFPGRFAPTASAKDIRDHLVKVRKQMDAGKPSKNLTDSIANAVGLEPGRVRTLIRALIRAAALGASIYILYKLYKTFTS
jgi:hypothetical protein